MPITAATMFELVKQMNSAFGNPEGDPRAFEPIFNVGFGTATAIEYDTAAWKRLEKQCVNIGSEFIELMQGFGIEANLTLKRVETGKAFDVNTVRDALCDINVFSLGAHHFMGYDAETDMQCVVDAVMTRFCKDQDELDRTIAKYTGMGVAFYTEGEFPRMCLKSAHDQFMPEYPKGKFLKAADYRQPVFYSVQDLPPDPEVVQVQLVDAIAAERAVTVAKQEETYKRIELQVKEYRNKLELEAFGLPHFDSNANCSGGFSPPI